MSIQEPPNWVLGSDEAGTGAWAGPFYVCAVILPRGWKPGVKIGDSKKLTPAQRELAFGVLHQDPYIIHSIVICDAARIDRMGAGPAIIEAHTRAQNDCWLRAGSPENVERIVDGTLNIPGAQAIPRADASVPACSIASILAKVSRDREMVRLDALYPGYGFASGKGYGTKEHEEALDRLGPCAVHRHSYAPVAAAHARFLQRKWGPNILDLIDELSKEE
jgi:ribonuclease HII